MLHQQRARGAGLVDVLDRVLDKGIVIDAWLRVSLVGVSLITVEARVVVASTETYLQHATIINHFALPPIRMSFPAPPSGRSPRYIARKSDALACGKKKTNRDIRGGADPLYNVRYY